MHFFLLLKPLNNKFYKTKQFWGSFPSSFVSSFENNNKKVRRTQGTDIKLAALTSVDLNGARQPQSS
jgi:hypothetical protein